MSLSHAPLAAGAALLIPLTSRVATMAAPCRAHTDLDTIADSVLTWAKRVGYAPGPDEAARLYRAGFHRLAGYAFADATTDKAALFAAWLAWNTAVDDALDGDPRGRHTESTSALFTEFLRILDGAAPRPGASVHEHALADLWRDTHPGTSAAWRERFIGHVRLVGEMSVRQADNRGSGAVPTPEQYRSLRVGTIGPQLFDLIEAMYRVRLPDRLIASPVWHDLTGAAYDVVAWCNDVASFDREHADGDTHNHVAVAATAYGFEHRAAAEWVVLRVEERMRDLTAAYRALPAEFRRLDLDLYATREASKVACVFAATPRAHLDWLFESERYGL